MRKRTFTAAAGDPPTLGALVAARLALAPAAAAALIARGAVQVDGRRASDATRALVPGQKLVVRLEEQAASGPAPVEVYADRALLVVDKPAGLLSQASRGEAEATLEALVQRAHPDARMLHRLDRDASGLVLFARAVEARAPLQAALERGDVERRYLAIAGGRLDGAGRITLRIARDPRDERRRAALPESAPGGQAAATRWRALAHTGDATLLEVELETGRTHQIRVHLAAVGHALVGDRLYGGPPAPRLLLHAAALTLPHPDDGRPLSVRAPLPPGWPLAPP